MVQQELMQIVYDNALGRIQEIKETIRRNKAKAHQLILLSFIAIGLIFQKIDIDIETIKTHSWPLQSLFWGGILCWGVSLLILLKVSHKSIPMDPVYTTPSKLLCREFLKQSYTKAIEGLAKSIEEGVKEMRKANQKLARNNFWGLIFFIISFFALFIYMMIA